MKRLLFVLLALLMAASFAVAEEPPVLKVSGDTSTYFQHDDAAYGVFDLDTNALCEYWLFKLALNAGYTLTMPSTNAISFGYVLSYGQAFGPVNVYASLASDGLAYTFGTGMAGFLLNPLKIGATYAKGVWAANADARFSAKPGYSFFQAVEVGGGYVPKWGYARAGVTYLVPQADVDDVGIVNAPATVEGLAFFVKAKVSY